MTPDPAAITQTQTLTAIRYLLFFAGTWLATHGYIPNADVNGLVAAVLIVAPPVWAFVANWLAKRQALVSQANSVQAGINLTASGRALAADGQTVVSINDGATPPLPVTITSAAEIVKNFAPVTPPKAA